MISSTAWYNQNEIKSFKCNHNNIAIGCHIVIYYSVENLILATKFSSIYLLKGEKRLFFRLSFVNLQRAKDGTNLFDAKYRCVCCINLIESHAWYRTSLFTFPNECLPCNKKMLLNLVAKWDFTHLFIPLSDFLWLYYSGYIHNFI